jgi:dienelactone hydrolase
VRVDGPPGAPGVLMMNGGRADIVPGDWSASIEWLARETRAALPLAVAELRYRVKSWKRLGMCVEDARAALAELGNAGSTTVALVGFSMGGAVSIAVADHPDVQRVVGLAPWMPRELDLRGLKGRHFVAIHGSIDGIPGIPGTRPRASQAGVERARALGVDAHHEIITGGLHGIARRGGDGRPHRLPRAARWREMVLDELTPLTDGG